MSGKNSDETANLAQSGAAEEARQEQVPQGVDRDDGSTIISHLPTDPHLLDAPSERDQDEDDQDDESSTGDSEEDRNGAKAVEREARDLSRWRWIIYLVYATGAIVCIAVLYTHLVAVEQENFQLAFESATNVIAQTATTYTQTFIAAMASQSDSLTQFALGNDADPTTLSGSPWPYVTMAAWEHGAQQTRTLAGLDHLAWAPTVTQAQQDTWQQYAQQQATHWIDGSNAAASTSSGVSNVIYTISNDGSIIPQTGKGPFVPIWQMSPPPNATTNTNTTKTNNNDINPVNYDLVSNRQFLGLFLAMLQQSQQQNMDQPVLSASFNRSDLPLPLQFPPPNSHNPNEDNGLFTVVFQPVYTPSYDTTPPKVAAVLWGLLNWDQIMTQLLLSSAEATTNTTRGGGGGLYAVLQNSCGQAATYKTTLRDATTAVQVLSVDLVGGGDLHPLDYQDYHVVVPLLDHQNNNRNTSSNDHRQCDYTVHLYASLGFEFYFQTANPLSYTALIAFCICAMTIVVLIYIFMVHNRQKKMKKLAIRANAVIASLFPHQIHGRIMPPGGAHQLLEKEHYPDQQQPQQNYQTMHDDAVLDSGQSLGSWSHVLPGDAPGEGDNIYSTKPIADLFPEATVMFADIVGFTAWSSTREPCQVFELLEGIYHTFDQLAKKRKVFKVETVGDCYVACAGLPIKRKDHAVLMARFAIDCLQSMDIITKKLEIMLGPETAELCLRVGLHSGSVTAGVLRGERSRFQLFGDTVNFAAKMEANGKPNHIHISEEYAKHLEEAGLSSWFTPRREKLKAKGLNGLQTYWLDPHLSFKDFAVSNSAALIDLLEGDTDGDKNSHDSLMYHPTIRKSIESDARSVRSGISSVETDPHRRLVEWNVGILFRLVRQIQGHRLKKIENGEYIHDFDDTEAIAAAQTQVRLVDEVKEVISTPSNSSETDNLAVDPDAVQLGEELERQLTNLMTEICQTYRDIPFHNFEHASHVTSSVLKLLSRIDSSNCGLRLEEDPLAQFALIFAAIIHDADHVGVDNAQLVKEKHQLVAVYGDHSPAEQNSFQVAWSILTKSSYAELRKAIYATQEEFQRFRSLLVNFVMATDMSSRENEARQKRWEKAFYERSDGKKVDLDRKTTLVMECLVQASNISHTMQHWHVFRKWNERLFRELYAAFKSGRMEDDPCEYWYNAEIDFFDHVVIPLARKVKECDVFVPWIGDESLAYALANRAEWVKRGQEVVLKMSADMKTMGES